MYQAVAVVASMLLVLSVSSVPVKVGIFNAKIWSENDHHILQIIHQLKAKDLLYHSVQKSFLIVCEVTGWEMLQNSQIWCFYLSRKCKWCHITVITMFLCAMHHAVRYMQHYGVNRPPSSQSFWFVILKKKWVTGLTKYLENRIDSVT